MIIDVSAGTVQEYQGEEANLVMRIYCRKNFTSTGNGAIVAGAVDSDTWYREVPCTVTDGIIYHDAFQIDSTEDGAPSNSSYTFAMYKTDGTPVGIVYKKIRVPEDVTPTTLDALSVHSNAFAANLPNTYYTATQIDQILSTLVNMATKATTSIFGAVRLSAPAVSAGDPIVVAANDPVWRGIKGTKYLESYGSLANAVSTIDAAAAVLKITGNTAVSASITVPANIQVHFEGEGKLTVASGQTVTIENMADHGIRRVFEGSGSVVLAQGAASKKRLAWWAPTNPASDCSAALAQASTNGGIVTAHERVFLVGGVTFSSRTYIEGVTSDHFALNGTIFRYTGSSNYIARSDGGIRNIGSRNCTWTIGESTTARCWRIEGEAEVDDSAFALSYEGTVFHGSGTAPTLVEFEATDVTDAWESVQNLFKQATFIVPEDGIGLLFNSVNTLATFDTNCWVLAAGATAVKGVGGYFTFINPDVRGVNAAAPPHDADRTITASTIVKTYTNANVNTTANTITITSHGFITGEKVHLTTPGTPAAPLVTDTPYYVIVVDGNTIKLANTRTLAYAGTEVDLSSAGSGTTTLASYMFTLNSGTLSMNDLGQPITFGGGDANIADIITSQRGLMDTPAASTQSATSFVIKRWADNPGQAKAFLHLTGDRANVVVNGGADEGVQYTLLLDQTSSIINLRSPIQFNNYYSQGKFQLNGSCYLKISGGHNYSLFLRDASPTASIVEFDGQLDAETVNGVTLQQAEAWGPRTGSSVLDREGHAEGHEGIELARPMRLTRRVPFGDNGFYPHFLVLSMATTGADPMIGWGRGNEISGKPDYWYWMTRRYDDGWAQFKGNQGAINGVNFQGYELDARLKAPTVVASSISPAAITSDQNDYSFGENHAKVWRLKSNASRNITGFAYSKVSQLPGEEHRIINVGQYPIVFKHQSTLSAAHNRIICDNSADITLLPNEQADVIYDTFEREVIVGDENLSEPNSIGSEARWRLTKISSAAALDGSGDIGYIEFADNPSDGDTIVINTVVITFLLVAGALPQTPIEADLKSTMATLCDRLNESSDPLLNIATYEHDGTSRITITKKDKGTIDTPAFELDAGTADATVSGATLDGAKDGSARRSLTAFLATQVVYQNDDTGSSPLSVTVVTPGTYKIEVLLHSGNAGGVGLATYFGGTATVTRFMGVWEVFDVVGGFNELGGAYLTTDPATGPDVNFTSAEYIYRFTGTATLTTAGTMTVHGSQSASDPLAVTLEPNSSLELRPL